MKSLVEFPLSSGGTIFVQVSQPGEDTGTVRVGTELRVLAEKAQLTFEEALKKCKPAIEEVIQMLRSLSQEPEEIAVEFGLILSSEVGAFVASVGAEANFKVTLSWKRKGK